MQGNVEITLKKDGAELINEVNPKGSFLVVQGKNECFSKMMILTNYDELDGLIFFAEVYMNIEENISRLAKEKGLNEKDFKEMIDKAKDIMKKEEEEKEGVVA